MLIGSLTSRFGCVWREPQPAGPGKDRFTIPKRATSLYMLIGKVNRLCRPFLLGLQENDTLLKTLGMLAHIFL